MLLLPRLFFQANDGIRGGTVTGVQTCALPISPDLVVHPGVRRGHLDEPRGPAQAQAPAAQGGDRTADRQDQGRSEERRVGKECRSRWAPDYDYKYFNERKSTTTELSSSALWYF